MNGVPYLTGLLGRSDVTNFDVLKASFDEIVKDFGAIHGLYV